MEPLVSIFIAPMLRAFRREGPGRLFRVEGLGYALHPRKVHVPTVTYMPERGSRR